MGSALDSRCVGHRDGVANLKEIDEVLRVYRGQVGLKGQKGGLCKLLLSQGW